MPALVDREKQALDEIAATRLRRVGSWILTAALLALVVTGPVIEAARATRGAATVFAGEPAVPNVADLIQTWSERGALAANQKLKAGLLALEDRMGRESALSAGLRPYAQLALARTLSYGNSQVVVARRGHLYFQVAFEHLTGPPFLAPSELARRRAAVPREIRFDPDPVPGLARFAAELAERDIRLVFLPVPVKAQIHPEPLLRGSRLVAPEPENPSTPELVRRLEAAGIAVYDPAGELRAAALAGERLYFATDTHWNRRGMEIAARGLAGFLRARGLVVEALPAGLERISLPHEFPGDLVPLLGLGPLATRIPTERVELAAVTALGGAPYRTVAGARDVLLLGDSYSVVFSFDLDHRAAGFAEQLAYELDRPIDRVAKAATNELPSRIRWLQDEPSLLDGKRVVIYEVTARALSSTDWSGAPLAKPHPKKRRRP